MPRRDGQAATDKYSQRDRLVNETAEEREAHLQYYIDRNRELQVVQSHLPFGLNSTLFEQRC